MAGEKSIVSGMAGRYATALFELAHEERAIDAVKADLDRFAAMIAESPDLARLVRSPVFTADEQSRAISTVAEKAGFSPTSKHFLLVVTKNRRLFSVLQMIRDFRLLVARHKGEASAEVTLAEKPSDQHLDAIRAALKGVTGKDVQIDVKIDPAIIGGLTVKLGSRMVDSSLRTKLNAIKFAMKEAR